MVPKDFHCLRDGLIVLSLALAIHSSFERLRLLCCDF